MKPTPAETIAELHTANHDMIDALGVKSKRIAELEAALRAAVGAVNVNGLTGHVMVRVPVEVVRRSHELLKIS